MKLPARLKIPLFSLQTQWTRLYCFSLICASSSVILIEDGASVHRSIAVKRFEVNKKAEDKLCAYQWSSLLPENKAIDRLLKKTNTMQ